MIHVAIEFYPTPYGNDIDFGQYWQTLDDVLDEVSIAYPGLKAMHTGVKGRDRFYEVKLDEDGNELETLKRLLLEADTTGAFESLDDDPVTVRGTTYEHSIRIHYPLPGLQRRRRR
jgi:hypothetical protein